MAEAWPSVSGAINQGLLSGIQAGTTMRKTRMEEEQAAQQKKMEELKTVILMGQTITDPTARKDYYLQEGMRLGNDALQRLARADDMSQKRTELFLLGLKAAEGKGTDALNAYIEENINKISPEVMTGAKERLKDLKTTTEASNLARGGQVGGLLGEYPEMGKKAGLSPEQIDFGKGELERQQFGLLSQGGTQGQQAAGDIIKERIKPEKATQHWNKVKNPKSSTGWSWQDQNTEKMGGEAPPPTKPGMSTPLLSWLKAADRDALLAVGTKQSIVSRLMQAYDTGDDQAIQAAMLAATGAMSSEQKAQYDKKKDWFMRNKTPKDVRSAYMEITPEPSSVPSGNVSISEGSTATNPKTGQKIIYKGGKWQPLK